MAKTNANTSIGGRISVELSLIKRLFRAGLCALVAKNALRAVFPLAGFLVDLHVHRTDPQAFAAVNAFILVTVDT